MSYVYVAVGAAALVGGYMSNQAQKDAAEEASDAQKESSSSEIAESRRQFDSIQTLLKPYADVGPMALAGQKDIVGLNGNDAQQKAISAIANGSQMQELSRQGENSMLQNASATGGLRGGNVQGALAQFRPQLLNQLIQQKYNDLGGLTTLGQNAAAGVGNAGQNSSNQIINSLQQMGASNAGYAMARGQADANTWGSFSNAASTIGTLKLMGKI